MSHIYPEIQNELFQLQENIENVAKTFAKPVPSGVKEELLRKIKSTPQEEKEEETIIHSIAPTKKREIFSVMNIAASILFLIAASFIALFIQTKNENQEVLAQAELQKENADSLAALNKKNLAILEHVSNTNTKEIELAGTDKYSSSSAKVFWNSNTSEVYAILEDLEELPQEYQYQLWALVDGVPVDMGAYDNQKVYFEKGSIEKAMAFAITIENRGGVETPTLDKMVVYGEI